MTHADAVNEHIAERYMLGELTVDEADRFEAHYFECRACAEDVRLTEMFQVNAKAVLAGPQKVVSASPERASVFHNWWAWVSARPAWAVAAVLLCTTTWQAAVIIPKLKAQAELARTPRSLVAAVLRAETRGAAMVLSLPRGEPTLLLIFDINAVAPAQNYVAELRSGGGDVVFSEAVKAPPAGTSLHLLVPSLTLAPGEYILTVRDEGTSETGEPIGSYRFELQRP